MAPRVALLALALAVLGAAGCGSAETPEPQPRPVETIDRLPDLPPGWHEHVNPAGGYAFGLPRGWKASDRGSTTEVRSFDRLVAIHFGADRTGEALALDPGEFATRALAGAPGYEEPLEPGAPRPFRHRYKAARASASGRSAETGVALDVSMIVMRRDRTAVLSALIAANASADARASRRLAERVVATVRSRPLSTAAP